MDKLTKKYLENPENRKLFEEMIEALIKMNQSIQNFVKSDDASG